MSLFTTTCEPSHGRFWPTPIANDAEKRGVPKIGAGLAGAVHKSSAAASPARTSARQERARALAASAAAYGRSTPELLARYDPATSLWRTSQLCLDGDLQQFSETWPRSGLTRSGTAYQLPPLVRLTDEIGSGLWPTPHGMCVPNARRAGPSGNELGNAVNRSMWPTPVANNSKNNGSPSQFNRNSLPLDAMVGGSLNPTWVEWLQGFPLGWTEI